MKTGGAFENDPNPKILNGHKKDTEGISRSDTTTNLRNFSSGIFLVPTETLKKRLRDGWTENTTNTMPGRHDNFSLKVESHEHGSEMDPYPTVLAENQGF